MAIARHKIFLWLGALAMLLPGCTEGGLFFSKSSEAPPVMRWDFRPEGEQWTNDVLEAITADGQNLTAMVPKDVAKWCPGYEDKDIDERAAFWAGLLSALAKHESTWNPRAAGGGGRWLGLVQIAPATARQYRCDIASSGDLFDGSKNLACAVKIMNVQVPKGGVVSSSGSPWRGMSADWAPYRPASKRNEMAAWTAAQPYCLK